MFRALTCPHSGGKIIFTQHLVSSLSVNGCTVHRLRADSAESAFNRCTVQCSVTYILLMNKELCIKVGKLNYSLFRNKIRFYCEELASRTTPKLEDHTLSTVRDCLFNIFAATIHIEGPSSIRDLRTCHAVVTRTHFSRLHILRFAHRQCNFCDQSLTPLLKHLK